MSSNDRIRAIRERLGKVTPGEWRASETEEVDPVVYVELFGIPYTKAARVLFEADWGIEADAEFIAHAPSDVEWLLGEVERMRAALEGADNLLELVVADTDWRRKVIADVKAALLSTPQPQAKE